MILHKPLEGQTMTPQQVQEWANKQQAKNQEQPPGIWEQKDTWNV